MKYNSINEYFSILQRRQFLPLFIPIIVFSVMYYLVLIDYYTQTYVNDYTELVVIALVLFSFFDVLISFLLFKIMVQRLIKKVSLGERMDGYAKWSTIRFSVIYAGSWMLVLAFFLSGYEWISIVFLIHFLFYFFTWPSRKQLCNDLKVSSTEKEVIM